MSITLKLFAKVCHQMAPVLDEVDIETSEVLAKLCDPQAEITKADGLALGVAFLLELKARKARARAARR
ncbi:MAG TPA: hypothetical protein VMU78_10355 [Methylocella sp.]|nr:hypothetical protein [Methylocella sp.]